MTDKLKPKDAKAKKRYDDEVKLRHDIDALLTEFSKKYDVECLGIDIRRNEWYGKNDWNCPMYNFTLVWGFDYLSHPTEE